MQGQGAGITAIGRYVPERVVCNHELAATIAVSADWIVERTGVESRHIADPGTPTSDLALRAAEHALRGRALAPEDLDLIIVATVTPDMPFPATACILKRKLGARRAWAFDVSAACCGFLYALTVAAQFVENGRYQRVLVVGAEVMSSIMNRSDRSTSVLFGDGAGAVILEPTLDGSGVLDYAHEAEGAGDQFLCVPAGGSALPTSQETVRRGLHFVHQEGPTVYKFAVRKLHSISHRLLQRNRLDVGDLALFVPHQGNLRIIESACRRLGVPERKVIHDIVTHGNTAAASIPLALCSALDEGRLRAGDLVLLASVGSGFAAASMLLRWSDVARPSAHAWVSPAA